MRGRRVRARRCEAGSANLSGLDLPVDEVVAATARIEGLVAGAKAAGHRGLLDTLRADCFLGLLTGRFDDIDDAAIVALLLADQDDPVDDGGTTEPDPAPGRAPARRTADDRGSAATGFGPVAPPPDPETGTNAPPGPDSDQGPGAGPGGVGSGGAGSGDAGAEGRRRGPRHTRLEVRVGWGTVLGLDRRPGELAGWGPVPAELVRHLVSLHAGAQWRLVVTDAEGGLLAVLVLGRRPAGTTPSGAPPSGVGRAVVELQVTADALDNLAAERHPASAAVIGEARRAWAAWQRARQQAADDLAAGRSPAETSGRFPPAGLARWVQTRDRCCVFPSCATTAVCSDLDHTVPVADGGPTTAGNLGPVCRHDHRLKHEGGWRLDQPTAGEFVWTGRTGARYPATVEPVTPRLPDPDPPWVRSCSAPVGVDPAGDGPTWTGTRIPSTSRTPPLTPRGDPRPDAPHPTTTRHPSDAGLAAHGDGDRSGVGTCSRR